MSRDGSEGFEYDVGHGDGQWMFNICCCSTAELHTTLSSIVCLDLGLRDGI